MIFGTSYLRMLAVVSGLTVFLPLTIAIAAAQSLDLPPGTPPAFRAMLADPLALRAVMAGRQGDFAHAAALLRDGARRGDSAAQVLLAQMYIAGKGVPQNYVEAARLLTRVAGKLQEPTFSVAMETLKELDQVVTRSGTAEQKAEVTKAELHALLGNPYVQQWLRNSANSQFRILNCFGMVCM